LYWRSAVMGGHDWFDYEVTWFESQMNEIVLPLFDATDRKLTEWEKQIDADFEEAISKAKDEKDETNAKGEAALKSVTVDEQRQLLGAACLGFVATAVKACLNDMAEYFESSHPPGREYAGKSWLQKRQDEYQQRFQIDFTKGPTPLARLEELILARNAGLHWEGSALEEYQRKVTSPRFIDRNDLLTFDRDNFLKTISEVQSFVAWVHTELKKIKTEPPAT
jgi:hypothetical protein